MSLFTRSVLNLSKESKNQLLKKHLMSFQNIDEQFTEKIFITLLQNGSEQM